MDEFLEISFSNMIEKNEDVGKIKGNKSWRNLQIKNDGKYCIVIEDDIEDDRRMMNSEFKSIESNSIFTMILNVASCSQYNYLSYQQFLYLNKFENSL